MTENVKFVMKVTAAHFVTYLVCGMFFSTLFHYETLFELGNVRYFMRDFNGASSLIGPFVQLIRGGIIGGVLLLLKDNLFKEARAWLKFWLVFAGLGIVCTPSPAPASIEGIVYSQLPLEFHLKGAPEIFVQTLLFSVWVTGDFKWKVSERVKAAAIVTAVSGAGFSLGGVLLTLALKISIMEGAGDALAFLVMFIAMVIVFFATLWYLPCERNKRFTVVYYLVCYFAVAVLPTIYNYLTDSALRSPLSLVLSGLPVIVIGMLAGKLREK